MTSITLANKYRPHTLDDVYGQDNIVTALKGTFKRGIPSAMLFSGMYGIGKTSLALIFARMANCEKNTICGKCMSCKFGKAHPDITIHDCAVDGKVDTIRSVVSSSRVAPMTRKRIIILDEVHALRDASEKALLIATENPSPNTIWILCSSNPEKINKPLLSRCTHMALKPISTPVMLERLTEIALAEGIKKTKNLKAVLEAIDAQSNGSLREAVSKLELVLLAADKNGKLDPNVVTEITGGADADIDKAAAAFVAAVMTWNVVEMVTVVRKANNARGILNKARWLVDYLIGVKTKTAKFTPYTGKLYHELERSGNFKTNMLALVMLQKLMVDIEIAFNSSTIDENLVMYSTVGNFIGENRP